MFSGVALDFAKTAPHYMAKNADWLADWLTGWLLRLIAPDDYFG